MKLLLLEGEEQTPAPLPWAQTRENELEMILKTDSLGRAWQIFGNGWVLFLMPRARHFWWPPWLGHPEAAETTQWVLGADLSFHACPSSCRWQEVDIVFLNTGMGLSEGIWLCLPFFFCHQLIFPDFPPAIPHATHPLKHFTCNDRWLLVHLFLQPSKKND